jgi:hypothetical protein
MTHRSALAVLAAAVLGLAVQRTEAEHLVWAYAQAKGGSDEEIVRHENLLFSQSSASASATKDSSTAWSSVDNGVLKASTSAVLYPNARASSASAWVRWKDTITIEGPEEYRGMPVQLRITYSVHGDVYSGRESIRPLDAWGNATISASLSSGLSSLNGQISYSYGAAPLFLPEPGPDGRSVSKVLDALIGDTLTIDALLSSQVFTSVYDYDYEGPAFYASSNFGNTSWIVLEPITEGISFNSSSGATYTAIPEPGSLALLGVGGAALLGRRRKK